MRTGTLLSTAFAAGTGAAVMKRLSRAKRPPYSFRGQTVLITGGSRGFGLVLARMLAREGANLALLARSPEELERAAQELRSSGAEVLTLVCDVREREQVEQAVAQTISRFDRLDVLVNNAGVVQAGPFENMTPADFEDALKVHMWGPLYATMAAFPHMRERGSGRIVNISSIGGKVAVPHLLPYSVSKFALVGLSDGLRAELSRHGVHVTTVAPGLMRTGSPYNALFKGNYRREFTWFIALDSLRLTSVSAERAARQVIEACRRGDTDLTISVQARAAVLASALFPSLFARAMQLTNALLPRPAGDDVSNTAHTGWESQSEFTRSGLTNSTEQAALNNNETSAVRLQTPGDGSQLAH